MKNKLENLKKEFLKNLEKINSEESLKELEVEFLGKK